MNRLLLAIVLLVCTMNTPVEAVQRYFDALNEARGQQGGWRLATWHRTLLSRCERLMQLFLEGP